MDIRPCGAAIRASGLLQPHMLRPHAHADEAGGKLSQPTARHSAAGPSRAAWASRSMPGWAPAACSAPRPGRPGSPWWEIRAAACTFFRSPNLGTPFCSTGPRMLAVATASWIARLMPTPPIGDMAWAASPMQTRPGRAHCVSRSTVTVRSLTWSKSRDRLVHPVGGEAGDLLQPVAEFGKAFGLDGVEAALGNQIGALPVIGAIDHHKKLAALDLAHQIDRIARPAPAGAATAHRTARPDPPASGRICRAGWNGGRRRRW